MNPLPKLVSIVIPLYNSARTIDKTLEACLNQDASGFETEVIVVDDGSTDGGVEAVKKYPVQVICQENSGPASARNKGWRAAKGEIVCFTDSDCVPRRDWIAKLMQGYVSDDVGGAGGTYGIMNDDNFLASSIHEEIRIRHERQSKFVNYLGSFNLSYKKSVLEEVGGFKEDYKRASGEDNDLAYRVAKRGYKLAFVQESAVAHYHPDRLFIYLRQQFWHGCWRMKIYKDHPDMASGDSYGGMFDLIQPPLALTVAGLVPAGLLYPPIHVINAFLLVFYLMIQVPLARLIVRRKGEPIYYLFALYTALRGFYRGAGLIYGVVKFGMFKIAP